MWHSTPQWRSVHAQCHFVVTQACSATADLGACRPVLHHHMHTCCKPDAINLSVALACNSYLFRSVSIRCANCREILRPAHPAHCASAQVMLSLQPRSMRARLAAMLSVQLANMNPPCSHLLEIRACSQQACHQQTRWSVRQSMVSVKAESPAARHLCCDDPVDLLSPRRS